MKFWRTLDGIERAGLAALAACGVALVVLLGVALWSALHPGPPCVRGHHELIDQPLLVGKVIVMLPEDTFVCDKRAAR